jgi:hypothetical protein
VQSIGGVSVAIDFCASIDHSRPVPIMKPATILIHIALVTAPAFCAHTAVAPTFTKDIAPILQKNCQVCHRPGEAGPFSMLTYEEVRPWASAMKEAVETKKMPPWFADARYGHF